MNPLNVGRAALRLNWKQKYLWLFGMFVSAGAGGGSGGGGGVPRVARAGGSAALPGWLMLAMIAGAVLGAVALVLHVISEGALIEGVRQGRAGTRLGFCRGLRVRLGMAQPPPSLVAEWLALLRVRPLVNTGYAGLPLACWVGLSPVGSLLRLVLELQARN